jgi:ABC-type proline/glycine betaine transport system permease subunit
METLQSLGMALGLASLAGLNLYLTVFVTGLAIQQGWINIAQTHPDLAVLGHPAIVAVAGVLYFLQFFADKVPWVDSLWDAVHTFIRPIGGAFLAIRVLGRPDPVFDVVVALLAGGATLMVHGMKAGTRLVVNHSPEPFSNIALSVTEDVAVLGGLALIRQDPTLALVVFAVILMSIGYFGPKLFRAVKVHAWLLWKKLTSPAADQLETELPRTLPHELEIACHSANLLGEKIVWAVPCVCGTGRQLPSNAFGYLIATEGEPSRLNFVTRRRWGKAAQQLDLATYKVAHEPKFLSENVILYSLEKKPKFVFLFARSQRPVVKAVTASLQGRLEASANSAPQDDARETPGVVAAT